MANDVLHIVKFIGPATLWPCVQYEAKYHLGILVLWLMLMIHQASMERGYI